jgi:hypothetical protein
MRSVVASVGAAFFILSLGWGAGCGGGSGSSSDGGATDTTPMGDDTGGGQDGSRGDAPAGDTGGGGDGGGDSGGGNLPGPLTQSANPNYFQDTSGRAILLAGSHTWNNLQDWGTSGTPQPLDFGAYASFLAAHGQNFTLLWHTELPKFCGLPTTDSNAPDFTVSSHPWQRTGPGMADDGKPKFDLTKFDQSYFDLMRKRVMALDAVGVWAGVYLFTGEWLNVYRCSGDGYPLTGGNNINSIDDGGGNGSMNMTAPNAITGIQDALADKAVDTLNDLPNVLWIVSEEASSSTEWWQGHMIGHVRTYETGKPHQHPIGLAMITGDPDSTIYDSNADWVAPQARISPTTSCGTGTPKCKVNVNDSDHSYFGMWNDTAQQNRQYAWQNFTGGNNVAFMDPYVVYYPRQNRNDCPSPTNGICSGPDPRWDNFRDNLGYIVSYSRKLDLNKVLPNTTLCSTGNCLAQTPAVGSEFLVYAPNGGMFTVDLSAAAGRTMNVEWFDPATGKVVSTTTVPGGNAAQSFTTPAAITSDAVLYLVDSKGHG